MGKAEVLLSARRLWLAFAGFFALAVAATSDIVSGPITGILPASPGIQDAFSPWAIFLVPSYLVLGFLATLLLWTAARTFARPALRAIAVAGYLIVALAIMLPEAWEPGLLSPPAILMYGAALSATACFLMMSRDVAIGRALGFAAAAFGLGLLAFQLVSRLLGADA